MRTKQSQRQYKYYCEYYTEKTKINTYDVAPMVERQRDEDGTMKQIGRATIYHHSSTPVCRLQRGNDRLEQKVTIISHSLWAFTENING